VKEIKRVVLIVLDSCGVGELPDAFKYGDQGSNTLSNTAKAVDGLHLPNLQRLGLGNIASISGVEPQDKPLASYGKMAEVSPGKDSTTGHWEMAGVILKKPFPVYPNGFPDELIKRFEKAIGIEVLGNKPASGTEIIKELGEEHLRTGKPIVYTSADSVFQIAAHEEKIPVPKLYDICLTARELLTGENAVARVIARPFVGKPGSFRRTDRRKDFSLPPPERTILEILRDKKVKIIGIGKINDLFAGRGISRSIHTRDNQDAMDKFIQTIKEEKEGLIFINLVDFDMVWGHRNDVQGFAKGLEDFDRRLEMVQSLLQSQDVLIITADHGCDPTTPSTDHSMEYVPLLIFGKKLKKGVDLGTRRSFSDISATLADIFEVQGTGKGESFWEKIYAL
jgi:phosphopentomutase